MFAHPAGALDTAAAAGSSGDKTTTTMRFVRRRVISGDTFGLAARDGGASEWEISVWARATAIAPLSSERGEL